MRRAGFVSAGADAFSRNFLRGLLFLRRLHKTAAVFFVSSILLLHPLIQAVEDDRHEADAALERSKNILEGERAELKRARDDLDRFSARVST